MKIIPIVMLIAGVVLIMAAKQERDPRNILFEALGIKQRVKDPAGVGGGISGAAKDLAEGALGRAGLQPSSATPSQGKVVSV